MSTTTGPTSLAECTGQQPDNLTVARARVIMREHLRCSTETCAARRTALALLVAAGDYVLAARR